jgi:protein-disulfide isomerase
MLIANRQLLTVMKGTMKRCTRVLLILALALASLAGIGQQPAAAGMPASGTSASSASLPSEATFNEFLKKTFGYDQNLTWKIAEIKPSEAAGISQLTAIFNTPQGQQIMRLYVTRDQKFAFAGDLLPFGADPFASTRSDLKSANGPSRGAQDATLTIVEFGDLQCPACKNAQPNINKLMEEEPKVRLVFQNFPLETVHKWAMTGAKYVDCLGRSNNDLVWKFIGLAYDHQVEINEQNVNQMLNGYVKEAGGDPTAVAACVGKPETEKRIRDSMALGEKVGVTSTPTFFIDGRRLQGFGSNVPYDVVKQMTDYYVSEAGK